MNAGSDRSTRIGACDLIPDAEVRARLGRARVALIGCGGLGSNAAAMLLRAGVRHLTLADHDTVAEDNLNRQLFFRDQIGRPKVEALAETLLRVEPLADLRLVNRRVGSADLLEVVAGADAIIEAVDDAATKAMIVEVCTRELPCVPLVTASGLAGYESANRIVTEQIADNLYVVGDLESDVRDGLSLLAPRVMVAAAHEAHAVVRLLLECGGV